MRVALALEPSGLVHDVDLDASGSSLAALQAAVGGPIECVGINHEFDMFLHEEGKYAPGLERNDLATVLLGWAGGITGDYIMGTVVFTGIPDDEGATQGLSYEQRGTLLKLLGAAALAVGPTGGAES